VYSKEATETIDMCKPETEDEFSRTVASYHLNKFADLDENGCEIIYPMLEAWGVNTIVMTGAWTELVDYRY
jgi:hypothetical protein